MAELPPRMLLVSSRCERTEMLVSALVRRFNARLTCAIDAPAALDADIDAPHDLVIAAMDLGDYTGVQLAQQLLSLGARPILLLGDEPLTEDVIEALRLGVRDVLTHPFPVEQLLTAAEEALRVERLRRAHLLRHRTLRNLVRRVIRERRDLNQRIDLLCRDLVGAQRRLVQRVLAMEQGRLPGA